MAYNKLFALIDAHGVRRYPDIIDGTLQIGKAWDRIPRDLAAFAREVLVHGREGRFVSSAGQKGTLTFSPRSRLAVAYELDAGVAKAIGVPSSGKR